jgi:hypothetical protein
MDISECTIVSAKLRHQVMLWLRSQGVTKGSVGRGNRLAAWRARLYIVKGRSPVGRSQLLPDEATTAVTWFRGPSWLASPHCQLHFRWLRYLSD